MSTNAILANTIETITVNLVDACALVGHVAETRVFPANLSIEQVREAIGLVAKRLGDSLAWKAKIAAAREVLAEQIDSMAKANAARRKAEAAARAEEAQKRLRMVAEGREARHRHNLERQARKRARSSQDHAATMLAKASGTRGGPVVNHGKGKKH